MTQLVVRRLLVDLAQPFRRDWNGGNAFRTAVFNALSMSFPRGEQFFIDSIRNGVKTLPAEEQKRFATEVQGFVGQEATHRRLHGLFNGHLEAQGYVNAWEPRIIRRFKQIEALKPRHPVAITAATEHLTALLSEHLLTHPEVLEGAEPRLRTMWLWHASEESEHRCTAFDVYRAMGGNERWRRRWFRVTTAFFLTDLARQTIRNLHHDRALFRWSTWRDAKTFLFGERGLFPSTRQAWKAYLREDFHPSQQDDTLSRDWLRDNEAQFRIVGT